MDVDFLRFPHTPHLFWLGSETPRSDKLLSLHEVTAFLSAEVNIEEKLDGANLGFSLAPDGNLRVQNRGQYLTEPYAGQFRRLSRWIAQHCDGIRSVLTPDIILFGEWCAARHSLDYTELPDWFFLFDVYDGNARRFWNSARRNALASSAGLQTVPWLAHGMYTEKSLKRLVETIPSRYRHGHVEGVVVRRESAQWCEDRAKIVRAGFTQSIETHWRKRTIEWNSLKRSDSHSSS